MTTKEYLSALCGLTGLSRKNMTDLMGILLLMVSQELTTSLKEGNTIHQINLGTYGSLTLKINSDNMEYQFNPSEELNTVILDTNKTGENLLIKTIETKLIEKIKSTYKGLL